MCRIGITLNTNPGQPGAVITGAQGRYKLIGASSWTTFTINDLNSPIRTPDIRTIGTYDLQVSVTNSLGITSDWAESTFSVKSDCNEVPLDPFRVICPSGSEPYSNLSHPREFIEIFGDPEIVTWTATLSYHDQRNIGWIYLNPNTTSGNGDGGVLFDINAASTTGSSIGVREADILISDVNNSSNNKVCTIQQYYYTNDII